MKFFLNRKDYVAEVELYRNSCLGTFLPAVEAYVDNLDGTWCDSMGNPLPPCIVMERGESLYDRMSIALTDKAGTAQARTHCVLFSHISRILVQFSRRAALRRFF